MDFAPLIPALATTLVGLVAGALLAWRLGRGSDSSPADSRARKDAIVELIRDLDADRAKLGEAAWKAERELLVTEAAAILAELDKSQAHTSSARGAIFPPLAFAALVGAFSVWALVAWPDGSEAMASPTPVAQQRAMPQGMGMGANPHADTQGLPDDVEALNAMTWQALLSDNLPIAMRANEKARTVAPDDPYAMTHRQVLRMHVGMHDKAREGLDAVLEQHPDFPRALLWGGLVRIEMNEPDQGKAMLQRVLEVAPADSDEYKSAEQLLSEL